MSTRPLALITGASSGIGAVFAEQLSARGFDLILVARRRDRLEQLASRLPVHCEVLTADLSVFADQQRIAQRLAEEPRLELLVNNAGFGTKSRFWEAPLDSQRTMHQLHIMATVELTHAALRNMVPKGTGAVINVASVAAFTRSPSNISYCATKSWMATFTEGLALELRALRSPVQVQALCPGFTYTEFHDTLGVDRNKIPRFLWMPADYVVNESLKGLAAGKTFVIPSWKYRLGAALGELLPVSWRLALERASPHQRHRV